MISGQLIFVLELLPCLRAKLLVISPERINGVMSISKRSEAETIGGER